MYARTKQLPIGLLLMAMLLSSCSFIELRKDLAAVNQLNRVHGTVLCEGCKETQIIVALLTYTNANVGVFNYFHTASGSEFSFYPPSGTYGLIAFADSNSNRLYDEGEPVSGTAPVRLDLKEGGEIETEQLQLVPRNKLELDLHAICRLEAKPFASRRTVVGRVTTMDDKSFDRVNADLGFWSPLRFLLEVESGIFAFDEPDSSRIPVVFVHGAKGTPRDFEQVVKRVDREEYQPWIAFYPSGLALDVSAMYLKQLLDRMRATVGFRDYVLVAHSMGGLVARRMMNLSSHDSMLPLPSSFISFSSPWGGHSGAAIGVQYAPAAVPSWREMDPSSRFLAELFNDRRSCDVPHTLIFGYLQPAGIRSEGGDGVLSLSSMLRLDAQKCAERVVGFNETHVGILSSPAALDVFENILNHSSLWKADE